VPAEARLQGGGIVADEILGDALNGAIGSPGSTSSLPVEITTMAGWPLTRRRAMPADAATAISGACSTVPVASSNAPWRWSLARRCMFFQGVASASDCSSALPASTLMSSTGTTQSQPTGSIAPVMISMQCSVDASVSGASPAACIAWIR
jgi:hypothetical protein